MNISCWLNVEYSTFREHQELRYHPPSLFAIMIGKSNQVYFTKPANVIHDLVILRIVYTISPHFRIYRIILWFWLP